MLQGAPLAQPLVHLRSRRSGSCRARRPWRDTGAASALASSVASVDAVGRMNGDADAEPDAHTPLVDLEVLGDGVQQALGERFRGRRQVAAGDDDAEFVPAETREESVPRGHAQTPGQLLQHGVARRMAEDVVHLLQPVEVEAQDGEVAVRRPQRRRAWRRDAS